MGRPRKKGLDYFPFNVGFFDENEIACIDGEFGIKGEITAIKLLCAIYQNGYFIEWNEAFKLKLLRTLKGITVDLLNQIVNRLIRWGFFDASLFDSAKVLTSAKIQRTYFNISKRWVRDNDDLPFLLVNVAETRVNVAETRVSDAESAQIKEKKIKTKEIDYVNKEKGTVGAEAVTEEELLKRIDFIFQDYVDSHPITIDNFCASEGVSLDRFKSLLREVFTDWALKGWKGVLLEGSNKFSPDHLLNTIRKKKQSKDHENKRDNRFQQRRGIETSARSAQDYHGSF